MSESDLHVEDACRRRESGTREVFPEVHSFLGLGCRVSSLDVTKHLRDSKHWGQPRSSSGPTWKCQPSSHTGPPSAAPIPSPAITGSTAYLTGVPKEWAPSAARPSETRCLFQEARCGFYRKENSSETLAFGT